MDDEQQIRDLIERWALAVHTGDMAGVLADHAPDIVMFDVPPPEDGVRGLADYEQTWPGFFEWQASGASFEIVSLDVTAGAEVAFAVALLRCGTPDEFARTPNRRLRLTLGLRRDDGRWVVAHEHHSFTDDGVAEEASVEQVRAVHEQWFEQTAAKDLEGMMANIADDVVSYEHAGPMSYEGVDAVREICRSGLESASGEIAFDVPDLRVRADGDLAVAWGIDRIVADGAESRSRATRVFEWREGEWQMIHQHLSFPVTES
ncbi:SgcJ/EcaC family oxidoreductase [Actinomycetospora sp.]|jgi:uncharacterized protein (TIGR02246 family)|uniref:YybH family protein n=1 Tax=Actinomycetospora sp. TaxID=1872135 RepID=UPI002F41B0D5